MSKPTFDDKYLDVYDPICRKLARFIFAENGFEVKDGAKFQVDQIVYKDGALYGFLEVEYTDSDRFVNGKYISEIWNGVSIPNRKQKFFKLHRPCWWMGFSQDLDNYIILRDQLILKKARVEFYKPNNNTKGEYFYVVDMDLINIETVKPEYKERAKQEVIEECHMSRKKPIPL
jgi:hypothetical protein